MLLYHVTAMVSENQRKIWLSFLKINFPNLSKKIAASIQHTFLAYSILDESNESSSDLQSTITSVSYNTNYAIIQVTQCY